MIEVGVLLEELEVRVLLRWGGRFRVSLRIKQNDVFCSCCSLLCVLSRFGLRVWCLLSAAHFRLVGVGVCCVLHVGFLHAGNFNFGGAHQDGHSSIERGEIILGRLRGESWEKKDNVGEEKQLSSPKALLTQSSPHSPKALLTGGPCLSPFYLVVTSITSHPVHHSNRGIVSSD